MSYILDALRKAERERHGKNPQGIHSHLPLSEGRRSSRLGLLVIVLLTLNLLLFGGWFVYGQLFGGPPNDTVQGEEASGGQQQPGRSAESQPATPHKPLRQLLSCNRRRWPPSCRQGCVLNCHLCTSMPMSMPARPRA